MGARASPAARVSDDQHMQLWTLAPRTVTWLALCGGIKHDLKDQALLEHHSQGPIHRYFHHTFGRYTAARIFMYGETLVNLPLGMVLEEHLICEIVLAHAI